MVSNFLWVSIMDVLWNSKTSLYKFNWAKNTNGERLTQLIGQESIARDAVRYPLIFGLFALQGEAKWSFEAVSITYAQIDKDAIFLGWIYFVENEDFGEWFASFTKWLDHQLQQHVIEFERLNFEVTMGVKWSSIHEKAKGTDVCSV